MGPSLKVLGTFALVALLVDSSALISDAHRVMRTLADGTTAQHTTGGTSETSGGGGATPRLPAWDPRSGASHYTFEEVNAGGAPVRWNPCQRIDIVVNLDDAPVSALNDLRAAVSKVNVASGLHLVVSGRTTANPAAEWGTAAAGGNGRAWAPVLVAFAPPGTGALQTPGAAASTVPVSVMNNRGQNVYISGEIVVNSEQNGLFAPGFGRGNNRGTLFLHELGHLVGLDHSDDPNQVMYPTLGHAPDLGAGDKAGLKALGAGGCLDVPAADSTS